MVIRYRTHCFFIFNIRVTFFFRIRDALRERTKTMDYVNRVGRMIDQEKAYVRTCVAACEFPFRSPSVTRLIVFSILFYKLLALDERVYRDTFRRLTVPTFPKETDFPLPAAINRVENAFSRSLLFRITFGLSTLRKRNSLFWHAFSCQAKCETRRYCGRRVSRRNSFCSVSKRSYRATGVLTIYRQFFKNIYIFGIYLFISPSNNLYIRDFHLAPWCTYRGAFLAFLSRDRYTAGSTNGDR